MGITLPPTSYTNIVVIGGSYVGLAAAQELIALSQQQQRQQQMQGDEAHVHRIIVVEKNSHFGHAFAWPRFAIVPGHEHKSFIPYSHALPAPNVVVHASAVSLDLDLGASGGTLHLDRSITLSSAESGDSAVTSYIPFEACILATGTILRPPGSMPGDGSKAAGVAYLRSVQKDLEAAQKIVILGGGAVGVQMATDLAVIYNLASTTTMETRKHITVVQSRRFMPAFHPDLDALVRARFDELGVDYVTGSRAVVPTEGFQTGVGPQVVQLEDGREIEADYVITATGQTPASSIVSATAPGAIDSTGYIRVSPSFQVISTDKDEQRKLEGKVWAVGDVAATGAPKAARPGAAQAKILARNVFKSLEAKRLGLEGPLELETYTPDPAAIHLTLGVVESVVFRNPAASQSPTAEATTTAEPWIKHRVDGVLDMGVDGVWVRRAPGLVIRSEQDYRQ